MKLSVSQSCITLSISEYSSNFQDITNSLLKFSKSFWINNTIINLSTKKELWERKKFLLNLYKLCLRTSNHNGHFLKSLMDAYEKPIKLIVKDTSSPVRVTQVTLTATSKNLHVKFLEDEKFMFWYFYNQLKKFTPQYDISKKLITFDTPSETLRLELLTLISQENILGNHMSFAYNKFELNSFFQTYTYNSYANNQVHIPQLSAYYLILNVKESDSFDVVRKQYIRLAKRFHPDHQGHLGQHEAKINTERFYKIQEAYEALKTHKNQKLAA